MANIMMTDACNLRCPYCFANEFVNRSVNEITEEAFDCAVDFIVGDGSHKRVGLIGGEPTLHSQFDKFLRKLIRNEKVENIMVYTNGILLDRYWDVITHPKVHILVNCNNPEDIGQGNFDKMCRNLDHLILQKEFKDHVTLGINMYSENFQYGYIIELLKRYEYHHVRVSITVPNLDSTRNTDAHAYFLKMKPRVFQFFHDLLSNKIVPNFDCNKLPSCLVTAEELAGFQKYLSDPDIKEYIYRSNIMNRLVQCSPVIDIRQDLTAVRCFGLSEYTKQNIRDFPCISDLQNYYIRTIDAYAYNSVYSDKCADCASRKIMTCTGGCLAFKINEIMAVQKYAEERVRHICTSLDQRAEA